MTTIPKEITYDQIKEIDPFSPAYMACNKEAARRKLRYSSDK